MTEQRAAAEALRFWLTGSPALVSLATGGIRQNKPKDGTAPESNPYVVFSLATGRDDYAQENIRVDTQMTWIVRGTCGENSPIVDDMDDAIDAALSNEDGGTKVVEQNGYRIWVVRERPLNTSSSSNPGRSFSYAGGWYRVNVRRLI